MSKEVKRYNTKEREHKIIYEYPNLKDILIKLHKGIYETIQNNCDGYSWQSAYHEIIPYFKSLEKENEELKKKADMYDRLSSAYSRQKSALRSYAGALKIYKDRYINGAVDG